MRALERPADGDADGALVFCHGFWGIPDELVDYMDELDPDRRLHCYLPQGPVHVDSGRYSWDRDDDADLSEVAAWLDAIPYRQKVIGGWSQGGWAAYMLGLGVGRPRPAGVIVLGTRFYDEPLDLDGAPEVFLAHGRTDASVEVEWARHFSTVLDAHGVAHTFVETGGGHELDPAWVPELRAYLSRVI